MSPKSLHNMKRFAMVFWQYRSERG